MIDKVAANNFYKDNGDKVKQNWFLYEYANILYSKIEEHNGLTAYRKKNGKEGVTAFCVYLSKRLRRSISRVEKKQVTKVAIDGRYVYELYPGNNRAETQKLLDAASDAWEEHLFACSSCPVQCLTEGFEITDMFDNLEKTGWPTI